MGINKLPDRVNGEGFDETWFNVIRSALIGDIVPRNSSGVATDQGGDVGSTTYRWNNAYLKKILLGTVANNNTIEESSSDLIIKVGGNTKFNLNATNGMDGQYLKSLSVPTAARGTLGELETSSSGSFTSAVSNTREFITNLEGSITTYGNPVWLGLIGTSNSSDCYFGTSGLAGLLEVWFMRGGSDIYKFRTHLNGLTMTPTMFWTVDRSLAAGTYTYRVEAKLSTDTFKAFNVALVAYEL